jgi:hypothetical protein
MVSQVGMLIEVQVVPEISGELTPTCMMGEDLVTNAEYTLCVWQADGIRPKVKGISSPAVPISYFTTLAMIPVPV